MRADARFAPAGRGGIAWEPEGKAVARNGSSSWSRPGQEVMRRNDEQTSRPAWADPRLGRILQTRLRAGEGASGRTRGLLKNLNTGGFAVIPAKAGMTIEGEKQNHLSASGGTPGDSTSPWRTFSTAPHGRQTQMSTTANHPCSRDLPPTRDKSPRRARASPFRRVS